MAPVHLYQFPGISYIVPLLVIILAVVRLGPRYESLQLMDNQWKTYHAIRGPLSHLPGPQWSKWTRLPLKLRVLKGERARYVHSLHERYGTAALSFPEQQLPDLLKTRFNRPHCSRRVIPGRCVRC